MATGRGLRAASLDPAQVPPGARVWSTVVERMDAGVPIVLHEEVDLPSGLAAGIPVST
jgi:hypothetical protein